MDKEGIKKGTPRCTECPVFVGLKPREPDRIRTCDRLLRRDIFNLLIPSKIRVLEL